VASAGPEIAADFRQELCVSSICAVDPFVVLGAALLPLNNCSSVVTRASLDCQNHWSLIRVLDRRNSWGTPSLPSNPQRGGNDLSLYQGRVDQDHSDDQLYDRYSRRVYGLLLRIVTDPSVAEMCWSTFTQAWRQAHFSSKDRAPNGNGSPHLRAAGRWTASSPAVMIVSAPSPLELSVNHRATARAAMAYERRFRGTRRSTRSSTPRVSGFGYYRV